jgi:hypothetical protein
LILTPVRQSLETVFAHEDLAFLFCKYLPSLLLLLLHPLIPLFALFFLTQLAEHYLSLNQQTNHLLNPLFNHFLFLHLPFPHLLQQQVLHLKKSLKHYPVLNMPAKLVINQISLYIQEQTAVPENL